MASAGSAIGLQAEDITIAEAFKPLGYATGQFGKNISATATISYRRCTASTSSSAIFIISMLTLETIAFTFAEVFDVGFGFLN